MELVTVTRTAAPNLLRALAPAPPRLKPLTPLELDDAITALVDRQELAGADESARLARVRSRLELELADALAE